MGKPGHVSASVVAVCGLSNFGHLWDFREVDSHLVDDEDHTHTFKRVEMKLGAVLPTVCKVLGPHLVPPKYKIHTHTQ